MKPREERGTNRDEDVQKVLQGGQLRNQLLHHFAEGLEDGVIVDASQVEAEGWEQEKEWVLAVLW